MKGTVTETSQLGNETPISRSYNMNTFDTLEGSGPFGKTSVELSLTLPLKPEPGQKMGPWAKVGITLEMPCSPNQEAAMRTSLLCEEFVTKRLDYLAEKILSSQS